MVEPAVSAELAPAAYSAAIVRGYPGNDKQVLYRGLTNRSVKRSDSPIALYLA